MPTVLVTGASRGLGLEFAREYAADGWRVHACSRNPEGPATEIAGDVVQHALDVTDDGAVAKLASDLAGEPLDLLINNAGVYGRHQQLGRIDAAEWEHVLRVNAIAPVLVTEALLPNLKKARGAKVALITSRMGSIADNTSG